MILALFSLNPFLDFTTWNPLRKRFGSLSAMALPRGACDIQTLISKPPSEAWRPKI